MTSAGSATCAEFRQDFRAYLGQELGASRRILVEDHLSRCPGCRARIAEMKGERPIVAMPLRSSSRWVHWGTAGCGSRTALRGPLSRTRRHRRHDGSRRPAGHGRFRRRRPVPLSVGSLEAGAAIGERESVRTGPGAHAVLRLADGSMVDVNERTELFVTAAWSGQAIHLQRGDIIVKAAKQRRGRLRVLTRDSIASVKGTVFAVSAGMGGSVVSVVEGSVAVNQPGREVVLSPGQQAASIPALASSVAAAVSWSPEAELPGAARVAREDRTRAREFPRRAADQLGPALVSSRRGGRLRHGPKSGLTIGRALALAEEQSAQNATFGAWWNSETGRLLRQMADRVQSVNPLLGDEIVFCASVPGLDEPVPMVMAGCSPASGRSSRAHWKGFSPRRASLPHRIRFPTT